MFVAAQLFNFATDGFKVWVEVTNENETILRKGFNMDDDTEQNMSEYLDAPFHIARTRGGEIPPFVWQTWKAYWYDPEELKVQQKAKQRAEEKERKQCAAEICKAKSRGNTTLQCSSCNARFHRKCVARDLKCPKCKTAAARLTKKGI